jgi:hypothetical protein
MKWLILMLLHQLRPDEVMWLESVRAESLLWTRDIACEAIGVKLRAILTGGWYLHVRIRKLWLCTAEANLGLVQFRRGCVGASRLFMGWQPHLTPKFRGIVWKTL